MLFPLKEYSIIIGVPYSNNRCVYIGCKSRDAHRQLIIKNDKEVIEAQYPNICDRHLLVAILDSLCEHE